MVEVFFFVLAVIELLLATVGIVQSLRDRCYEIDDYDEWCAAHGIDIRED